MISQNSTADPQGLIVPKKLVNPCLESLDRQNLHRELLFNQKLGKKVLNQKTELQKALEKQKERQAIFTHNDNQKDTRSLGGELEKVIMERAQRLENKSKDTETCSNNEFNAEYLKARAKLRGNNNNDFKYA
ncbi:unnamed protein product [Diamesa hyperborea]